MSTRTRAPARVKQEASAFSVVPPQESALVQALRVDEATAVSASLVGCQPVSETPNSKQTQGKGVNNFSAVKRVRYDRNANVPFEMTTNRVCFKGGFLKTDVVLTTIFMEDTRLMRLGPREDWLCLAATGRTERRGTFPRAVSRVKTQLHAVITNASHAFRDQKVKAAASGRAALDLPESSSSELRAELRSDFIAGAGDGEGASRLLPAHDDRALP